MTGEPVPFAALGLSKTLLTVVAELGYEHATRIQSEAIPLLLAGKDLIGKSRTGSGKTAAFALPILHALPQEGHSLAALILCPTRELCAQVTREFRKLGRGIPGLSVLSVSGGSPAREQIRALNRGVDIVVGTPGRVLDLQERDRLDLSSIRVAVIDEADRMLDMGFEQQVNAIVRTLPSERQTLLFSATYPESIRKMGERYQRNAQMVSVMEEKESAPAIAQKAYLIEAAKKPDLLRWLLGTRMPESVLIFCNFKATVASVSEDLQRAGVGADCLHGDLEQPQRDEVLARFRGGGVRVLVATDVAARGIDVEGLQLVVNYELPNQIDSYVHRIGRTGRAGKDGDSVSFVTERDQAKLLEIEEELGVSLGRARSSSEELALFDQVDCPSLMDTLAIGAGRKDKLRPGDILGALTGEAGGLAGNDIGKIEIHDRHAFVAIKVESSKKALQSLSRGRIKGRRFRISMLG